MRFRIFAAFVLTTFSGAVSHAGRPSQAAVPRSILAPPDAGGLTWRNVGPGRTGTRIVDFAVVERDPRVIYVATASSGVWKTTNAGTTWAVLFEKENTVSLGGIAVSQSHPDIVWVATGEPNARNLRGTSRGDGVYKSTDGGHTWRHMGLADSQHMGRIVIHPTNPDVVYATVVGSLWHNDPKKNAVRGLYKTSDGGATWRKVASAGEHGGFVDVALDPARPDTVYAAAWHRERRDWSFVNVGAEGGIYRSPDAGATWTKLSAGLPATPVGRIGLSVCRSRPTTIYAVIEGRDAGVFRSVDGGSTWTRRNPMPASSMYYGQVRCDPADPERVHVLQTQLSTSTDGGTTFGQVLSTRGVHVDHHALWTNPADPDHLLLGNDGGIYQSRDRGATWHFHAQMSAAQVYAIGVDMREPFYYVCAGTQDNNSLCGPSATRHTDGIVNDDWYVTTGGDGFSFAIDPTDPSVVYTEAQYGALVRFNPFTGERRNIRPQPPQGTTYRWNWNSPMRLSPHDPNTLYYGSQFLFRTRDKGATWETISPDLTRQIAIEPRYRISDYGTLLWIHESPRRQGLIAVGTDDGLIQITEDGGQTWAPAAALPGVPERAQIRRVLFSAHADRTMYAAASAHEEDDFNSYIFRSTDLGRTWTNIANPPPSAVPGILPRAPVFALAEDPTRPGLLFAGTEFGIYVTFDDGLRWTSLKQNLPTVPVHDILIHPRERDLIIGTHGRGIWIMDSIRGLQGLTADVMTKDAAIFAPRPAVQFPRFDRGRSAFGQSYFTAPNPPDGVYIDYYVNAKVTAPVTLEIFDAAGARVRRIDLGPREAAAGLRRAVWDMRAEPAPAGEAGRGEPADRGRAGGAGGGGGGRGAGRGTLTTPGTYEVRLTVGTDVQRAEVVVKPEAGLRPPAASAPSSSNRVTMTSRRVGQGSGIRPAAGAMVLALAAAALHAQSGPDVVTRYREANGPRILRDFATLLTYPNRARDTADIERAAAYIRDQLQAAGVKSDLLRVDGAPPIVYGALTVAGATRTLGIYVHYDGQPVDPKAWAHPPFEPTLYTAAMEAGGRARPMPRDGETIDPEWRLYARSAGDDKAPIAAILTVLHAFREHKIQQTSNLVFFLDGEEEAGSPHLGAYLTRYRDRVDPIDIWLFFDGPVHQSGRPQITFGVRGAMGLEVTVYGATRELHSGHYGNWAPDTPQILARLLTSMKDETGRVLVEGWYDSADPIGAEEKAALAAMPDYDGSLKRELGLVSTEGEPASLAERLLLPALTVRGISGGNTGALASNVIPATATAALGIRLVKGNDPATLRGLIVRHIERQGFHVVASDPDQATRLKYPRIAKVTGGTDATPAARTSMSNPFARQIVAAAGRAAERRFGAESLLIAPGMGGTLPLHLFTDLAGKPAVIVPIANHDNNQHGANENLRIANLWYAIDLYAALLTMDR